jgi:ElaB/YqjD/DUF883 family membrane-anchored ribosome-binding protein
MTNPAQLEQAIAIPTAIVADLNKAKEFIDSDNKDEAKKLIDKVAKFMQSQADMAKKELEAIMKKHEEALEVLKKDKHVDLQDPFIMMLNESTYTFKRKEWDAGIRYIRDQDGKTICRARNVGGLLTEIEKTDLQDPFSALQAGAPKAPAAQPASPIITG